MCYSRRPTSFIVTCILHNIRVLHESQKSTQKGNVCHSDSHPRQIFDSFSSHLISKQFTRQFVEQAGIEPAS